MIPNEPNPDLPPSPPPNEPPDAEAGQSPATPTATEPVEPPEPPDEIDELWAQIYKLQTTLAAALVAVAFLSLGLILFMGKQMTNVRARLAADRQNTRQDFADFQKVSSPKIRSFVHSLQVFAATNETFVPVLEKYRPLLSPYFSAPTAAVPTPISSNSPTATPPEPPKAPPAPVAK